MWCDNGLTGRRDGMLQERKKHEDTSRLTKH